MTQRSLTMQDTVSQAKGFFASDMYEDKVMMGLQSGNYYNLSGTGGQIWDLMESPVSVSSLIETLTAQYEIEESVCQDQVLSFLQTMAQEQLIVIHSCA